VHFALLPGEIHGLVGENGAGKSTLMKIIAGVHAEYQGEMSVDGHQVRYASPRDARSAGIGMVHQELSGVPDLSIAENVYLGIQPVNRCGLIDWRAMRRGAAEHLQSLGIELDPRMRIGALPLGLQQLVEIARVLFSGARIIILDEPTSACRHRKSNGCLTYCAACEQQAAALCSYHISWTTCSPSATA
jgi:ribose transport system ATP-binding protein